MRIGDAKQGSIIDALTGVEADAVHAALERMHVRDRERVAKGELSAADLHLIPALLARRSTLHLPAAAGTRFKVRR